MQPENILTKNQEHPPQNSLIIKVGSLKLITIIKGSYKNVTWSTSATPEQQDVVNKLSRRKKIKAI